MSNRLLLLICLLLLSAIFVAGLWPFGFNPHNNVSRLGDRPGVAFGRPGIIYSPHPYALSQGDEGQGGLTIEIWCRPDSDRTASVDRLLSVYDSRQGEIFLIGQWKTSVMISTDPSILEKGNGRRKMGTKIPVDGSDVFVTFTSHRAGSAIYVNGAPGRKSEAFVIPGQGGLAGILVLGNDAFGKSPWKGRMYGCAIYGRAFTPEEVLANFEAWKRAGRPSPLFRDDERVLYLFAEKEGELVLDHSGRGMHLLLSEFFTPPERIVLSSVRSDFRLKWTYFQDVLLNILGFIPLGAAVCVLFQRSARLRGRRGVLLTIVFGAFCSLAVELLQVYLPTRHSQLTDVIMNVVGAAIGGVIGRGARNKVQGNRGSEYRI